MNVTERETTVGPFYVNKDTGLTLWRVRVPGFIDYLFVCERVHPLIVLSWFTDQPDVVETFDSISFNTAWECKRVPRSEPLSIRPRDDGPTPNGPNGLWNGSVREVVDHYSEPAIVCLTTWTE